LIPSRFQRIITRGKRFIPEVDGLRFVAIMGVVLYHIGGYTLGGNMNGASVHPGEAWVPRFLALGSYGVELFFVLSGFLLVLPFARWRLGLGKQPSLGSYYLRRLTRLEPPYVIAILLQFIAGSIIYRLTADVTTWPRLANWRELLAHFIYQHNLIFGQGQVVTSVTWSLEIEVQFYMLAPLLASVFSIRSVFARRVALLGTLIAIPILRSFLPTQLGETFKSLPWFLEWFIAGFLLADFYLVDWREAPSQSLRWDLVSLASWSALCALLFWNVLPVILAPVVLVAYMGAFRGKISSWFFSRPLVTIVGGMCYSMYLLHLAVVSGLVRLTRHFPVGSYFVTRFVIDACIVIPVIFAVTVVFFVFLERPCMDPAWPRKVRTRLLKLAAASGGVETKEDDVRITVEG
jgi:peptidoglycan/LPS O-acetylase OafA/YrhL